MAFRPALVAGLLIVATSSAADWPQWRGPNRDGHSKDVKLLKEWPDGGPMLSWAFEEAGAGYSSPAVVGDTLYILGAEDAETGDKEFAVAVSVRDGKRLWKTPLGDAEGNYEHGWGSGPRSTPTVDGDRLYVLGAKGDLLCLNAKTGDKVWSVNLVADLGGGIPNWGYSESPLVDGDKVICTPGGNKGAVAALDKKTGEVLWRSKNFTDPAGYSSVVIAEVGGTRQYVQQTMQSVAGVNAEDGRLIWRERPLQYRTAVIPTPVVHDDLVFVTSGYGAGSALIKLAPPAQTKDKATSKVLYANKAMVNHHGGVVRVGDHIYGYSDNRGWVCLDYKKLTGDEDDPVWSSKKLGKGSVSYADGHLYCYSEGNGTMALVEASPKGWNEKGRLELPRQAKTPRRGGHIWAHPVIANGNLYLRDMELLFCFDVKAQ